MAAGLWDKAFLTYTCYIAKIKAANASLLFGTLKHRSFNELYAKKHY
jgi:hypothetical protein